MIKLIKSAEWQNNAYIIINFAFTYIYVIFLLRDRWNIACEEKCQINILEFKIKLKIIKQTNNNNNNNNNNKKISEIMLTFTYGLHFEMPYMLYDNLKPCVCVLHRFWRQYNRKKLHIISRISYLLVTQLKSALIRFYCRDRLKYGISNSHFLWLHWPLYPGINCLN